MAAPKTRKTKRTVKVAAAQLPSLPLASADKSLAVIERAVRDAARRGSELLVLPECAYPAYYLGKVSDYRSAKVMSGQAFVERLSKVAADNKINLVCGFVDDSAEALRNAAVVIDATGAECGRHHKSFLWGEDNDWFQPGDRLAPFETPLGKIGVVICADARAPETAAGLVAAGARLIAVPACWVNLADRPGQYGNPQAEFMIQGRAQECSVPFIAANKFGAETDELGYCGGSLIVDADGKVLAQAPPDKAAVIQARVSLAAPPTIEIPDWGVRRIFSNYPPVQPEADGLGGVKIAVAPSRLVCSMAEDSEGRDLFHSFAAQGVRIVGTCLDSSGLAERVEIYGRALGMTVIGYPFVERLMIERFGAFGCVASEHIYSFVPARVMSLDGASIVFVTGEEVPLPLLRTRAAENRVFIAAATADSAALIAPDGDVIDAVGASDSRAVIAEIDLTDSADKHVYPGTHIWEQRRPAVYADAFGIDRKLMPRR